MDVYLKRDIANVLRATAYASNGSLGLAAEILGDPELVLTCQEAGIPSDKLLQVYYRAVRNTLITVGVAFGLEPVAQSAQRHPEVPPGLSGLLWAEIPQER